MVKCVVTGCPNRSVDVNRGVFKPTPKRFFDFPKDPARVKIWLAALRETDKDELTEQHQICEDHFLPDDVTSNGINPAAIPIMPPYLDGQLGLISPWTAESSEEEEEEGEEEQQQQWGTGGCEEEEEDEGGDAAAPQQVWTLFFFVFLSVLQDHAACFKIPPEPRTTSPAAPQTKPWIRSKGVRQDVSLGTLTRGFLELLQSSPDGCVDIHQAMMRLQTRRRRVYDITNVLDGINLIEKQSKNKVKWTGRCSISSLANLQKLKELENLKQVEDALDGLIKSCARQLFDMTDDAKNASAYVTLEDVSRLPAFHDQTVIVVKAPEETKLEIPAPREDVIQVHLKAMRGSVTVLTCEVDSGGTSSPEPGEIRKHFEKLEESRIKTSRLHTESSGPQSAVKSA
ncbi:transcription factor E2F2-like [Labrus mixtus]|uniref:transcription factor E2F2-like n=1 Tax=Labrus mixtus TaxID=508554 RepID=UPI0029C0878A|nr:transcription factor E2F2-like [Labrus mixtus]